MNEQDALKQMVSPGMERPGIWRKGVLQIWITRGCDLSCFGCTQGSNLGGKPGRITLDQFTQAVDSLKGYFGVVGIFGGNPALHPQFDDICAILRERFPREQCGLWCNHPRGRMEAIKATFNPAVSNLNVHLVREAYDQFVQGWPDLKRYMKGLDPSWPEAEEFRKMSQKEYDHRVGDARHSPPYVAMQDLDQLPFPDGSIRPNTPENRWELIANCDINKHWSAMLCVFRDQLRGFFCEIAGAQAMLHQNDSIPCPACGGTDHEGKKTMQYGPQAGEPVLPCWECAPDNGVPRGPAPGKLYNYPDTGVPVEPGWWRKSMQDFAAQVRLHCHACGIPIRSQGELAVGGTTEKVSASHQAIFVPKSRTRNVELVQLATQLPDHTTKVTNYIENGKT